jgi:uncharacterized protein (TIGR03437 family)
MRLLAAVVLLSLCPAHAAEADALRIDARIRAVHMPFGTLLDPIYDSASGSQIVGYTRCGDSALWTGAYLAAESFRYNVTKSADALANVRAALASLTALSAITGDNRLARCMVLASSPFADGIAREEAQNQVIRNPPWLWVDNTSRDQIVGAFFGLGVAFDLVDQPDVKQGASDLATLLIGYISRHQWSPNDDVTSTFRVRPEGLQMLLQVARHLNPANDVTGPFLVAPVDFGIVVDVLSNSSYFKFDLDYMSLYHLVRLQNNFDNRDAYVELRNYTASHQNAFFNLIDRALRGPDAARDAETRALLEQVLQRPARDFYTDLSTTVPVCGSEACKPIPVPQRPPATFLWETSPFQLQGGGSGLIENSGLDYVLPYWMARYYGVIGADSVVSSASPSAGVAAGSLATIYAPGLAAPVSLTDSAGVTRNVTTLYVSSNQINFLVPDAAAPGLATVTAGSQTFPVTIHTVAPGLFSMNGTGSGVAAALAIATLAGNPQIQSPVPVFDCGRGSCVATPLVLGIDRPIYVSFYGTGIRNGAKVTVSIAGLDAPVQYAGPAPGFLGLDQVNVALPVTLRGRGDSNVVVTVDGIPSNAVTINVQ